MFNDDMSFVETPLISRSAFRNLSFKYTLSIILSKERLLNAIEIQKKFLTKEEILDFYSIFFKRRVKNLKEAVFAYAR